MVLLYFVLLCFILGVLCMSGRTEVSTIQDGRKSVQQIVKISRSRIVPTSGMVETTGKTLFCHQVGQIWSYRALVKAPESSRQDLAIQKGSIACFLKNKGKFMIQTITGRCTKQPKWDPSRNRQKQPLPKPKTTRTCPKTAQQQ